MFSTNAAIIDAPPIAYVRPTPSPWSWPAGDGTILRPITSGSSTVWCRRSIATSSCEWSAPDPRPGRPVFVFGLPRSGTTLIEQVLASHSQIHGAGELSLARRSFESVPTVLDRSGPPRDCVAHLDRAAVQRLADQHLRGLEEIDGGRAERIVDKMPDNTMYLGLLSVLFPKAVFVHCRRDPRDVAVSCWMSDFRILRWANNFDHIATRLLQYVRLMDHWRAGTLGAHSSRWTTKRPSLTWSPRLGAS